MSPNSWARRSEKFFVGPAFSVRDYNFINAPWDELEAIAQDLMASYDVPEEDSFTGIALRGSPYTH